MPSVLIILFPCHILYRFRDIHPRASAWAPARRVMLDPDFRRDGIGGQNVMSKGFYPPYVIVVIPGSDRLSRRQKNPSLISMILCPSWWIPAYARMTSEKIYQPAAQRDNPIESGCGGGLRFASPTLLNYCRAYTFTSFNVNSGQHPAWQFLNHCPSQWIPVYTGMTNGRIGRAIIVQAFYIVKGYAHFLSFELAIRKKYFVHKIIRAGSG